jgi:hypothetical protein
MNQQQKQRMNLFSQYRQVYGDLDITGAYEPGDRVKLTTGGYAKIIWVYRGVRGRVYVIDDNSGFPAEASVDEIAGRA